MPLNGRTAGGETGVQCCSALGASISQRCLMEFRSGRVSVRELSTRIHWFQFFETAGNDFQMTLELTCEMTPLIGHPKLTPRNKFAAPVNCMGGQWVVNYALIFVLFCVSTHRAELYICSFVIKFCGSGQSE